MKYGLLTAVLLMGAGGAVASPLCTDYTTLAQYVALGSGGCTIGDKLFSSFSITTTYNGASGPGSISLASLVNMTPVNADSSTPGLVFTSDAWKVSVINPIGVNTIIDSSITFDVSVIGGARRLEDAGLSLLSYATSGDGEVAIGETLTFSGGGEASMSVDSFGPYTDHTNFPVTNAVHVSKDLFAVVWAGTTGTAQITSFREDFSQIPEPAGVALIGSGLIALGLIRRRRA